MSKTLTLSSKYQIAIPKSVRERMGLKPGQQLQVVAYGNRLELIPVRDIRAMRGFLAGIDTEVPRDQDRL